MKPILNLHTSLYRIKKQFINGHERSVRAKKNIALIFLLRGINVGSSILIVPLMLSYVGQTKYGIWLTLLSIVLWFEILDMGLSNGLRNKLSEALSRGHNDLALKYISTSYVLIAIVSVAFLFIFIILNQYCLDWSAILNTRDISKDELSLLALIVFGLFSVKIIVKLIYAIVYAYQNPAMKELSEVAGKLLNLLIVFVLLNTTQGSLKLLALSFCITPVLILVIFSVICFYGFFKNLAPKLNYVDLSLSKDLFGLGYKFFILQISVVVLYATDNTIIAHLFSPSDVPSYQIAQKYFGIILLAFGIILEPFWSAITEAYVKNDIHWIKGVMENLCRIWLLIILILIVMLLISEKIYRLWVGDSIVIPFTLSLAWASFYSIQSLNHIFIYFINGVGKLRVQMLYGVIAAIINIPLSILLAKKFQFGTAGVITATLICQSAALVLYIVQYNKIINGELRGVWGK